MITRFRCAKTGAWWRRVLRSLVTSNVNVKVLGEASLVPHAISTAMVEMLTTIVRSASVMRTMVVYSVNGVSMIIR